MMVKSGFPRAKVFVVVSMIKVDDESGLYKYKCQLCTIMSCVRPVLSLMKGYFALVNVIKIEGLEDLLVFERVGALAYFTFYFH